MTLKDGQSVKSARCFDKYLECIPEDRQLGTFDAAVKPTPSQKSSRKHCRFSAATRSPILEDPSPLLDSRMKEWVDLRFQKIRSKRCLHRIP